MLLLKTSCLSINDVKFLKNYCYFCIIKTKYYDSNSTKRGYFLKRTHIVG